jgi:hypothetical protein
MSGIRSSEFAALKKGCDPNTPRQCKKCGKVLPVSQFALNGNGYYEHECQGCKSARMKAGYKKERLAGSDRYWEKRLMAIHQGAKLRGISCDITIEHLKAVFEKQKGLCYYTDEPMKSCSVDRIDPDRGYQPDNIIMCERYINVFRGDLPIDTFLKLCHRISRAHPEVKRGSVQVDEAVMGSVRQVMQVEGVRMKSSSFGSWPGGCWRQRRKC